MSSVRPEVQVAATQGLEQPKALTSFPVPWMYLGMQAWR